MLVGNRDRPPISPEILLARGPVGAGDTACSQEGFSRLHSSQVQSLHWAVQEAAERREQLFCVCLDFQNAFNSIDHEELWWWLKELNIPDVDLLQSL